MGFVIRTHDDPARAHRLRTRLLHPAQQRVHLGPVPEHQAGLATGVLNMTQRHVPRHGLSSYSCSCEQSYDGSKVGIEE
jgi:hypothetical protein